MSKLLYLTAVLVSIVCCSLLSSATAEETKYIQLGKEETLGLGQSRNVREAGKRKKPINGENGKSRKKGNKGPKRKPSRKKRERKKLRKSKNERQRNNSLKRRGQRSKQKRKKEKNSRPRGKKGNKKEKKKRKRGNRNRPRREKRKKKQKKKEKKLNQFGRNGRNVKLQNDSCVQKLNGLASLGSKAWRAVNSLGRRSQINNEQIWSKWRKLYVFYKPFRYLLRALGGSTVNPLCRGVPANSVRETQYLETLGNCETTLYSVCRPQLDQTTELVVFDCLAKHFSLKRNVFDVLDKNDPVNEVCRKMLNSSFPVKDEIVFTNIVNCSATLKKTEATSRNQKKICLEEFRNCRQAERQVATIERRCRTRVDSPLLVLLIEIVINLRGYQIRTKYPQIVLEKPTSFNWAEWPKQGEITDESPCSSILRAWTLFNLSAKDATESAETAENALLNLESIMERKELEEELFACKDTSVFEQIGSISTLALNWMNEVVEPKIDSLTELQNIETTCSTTTTVTTIEVTTVSPERRSNFLMKIKKWKKL